MWQTYHIPNGLPQDDDARLWLHQQGFYCFYKPHVNTQEWQQNIEARTHRHNLQVQYFPNPPFTSLTTVVWKKWSTSCRLSSYWQAQACCTLQNTAKEDVLIYAAALLCTQHVRPTSGSYRISQTVWTTSALLVQSCPAQMVHSVSVCNIKCHVEHQTVADTYLWHWDIIYGC